MRLSEAHQQLIKREAQAVFGAAAAVFLFGSRVNDHAKGGDVDIFISTPHEVANPALKSAQLATRVSRKMYGRKVDVVLSAPGLKKESIHDHAEREGVRL